MYGDEIYLCNKAVWIASGWTLYRDFIPLQTGRKCSAFYPEVLDLYSDCRYQPDSGNRLDGAAV